MFFFAGREFESTVLSGRWNTTSVLRRDATKKEGSSVGPSCALSLAFFVSVVFVLYSCCCLCSCKSTRHILFATKFADNGDAIACQQACSRAAAFRGSFCLTEIWGICSTYVCIQQALENKVRIAFMLVIHTFEFEHLHSWLRVYS